MSEHLINSLVNIEDAVSHLEEDQNSLSEYVDKLETRLNNIIVINFILSLIAMTIALYSLT